MDEIIWRGMTRAQLDAAYNNTAAVRNSADKLADWTERSKRVRAERGELLDLEYGRRPRNRIDIFRCGKAHAPLLVYIHGGYWQRNAKEFFACLAEGPIARGFDAALVGYTLAPEATLTEIVGEVRMAIHWLRENGSRYDIAGAKLIVSGWSAGGHLTAMALAEADAGLAISGIFDIEPCRLNYLNDALKIDDGGTGFVESHSPTASELATACDRIWNGRIARTAASVTRLSRCASRRTFTLRVATTRRP